MTVKKAKFIRELLEDIDRDGFSSRQSYHYELNDSGEIIKVDPFKRPCVKVYATKEEVDAERYAMEMNRKAYEAHLAWLAQKNG